MHHIPPNIDLLAADAVLQITSSAEFGAFLENVVAKAREKNKPQLVSVSLPIQPIDALAVLEWLGTENDFKYYWERPTDDLQISASSSVKDLRAHGPRRFELISSLKKNILDNAHHFSFESHSLAGIHFLGGFSFHDEDLKDEWAKFGAAHFVVPRWSYIRDGKFGLVTVNAEILPSQEKESFIQFLKDRLAVVTQRLHKYLYHRHESDEVTISTECEKSQKSRWNAMIGQAREEIAAGEYKKIVLARRQEVTLSRKIEPTHIVNALRQSHAGSFTFFIQFDDSAAFVGSTPERLFSTYGNILLSEALAGTIQRGKTASEDAFLERELLNSDKDREEHNVVVEAVEEALRPFTKSIEVPENPETRRLPNVFHLYSPIKARLKDNPDIIEIIRKLHPTPAVGGHPREETVHRIRQFEDFERGWYASPIGWMSSTGRAEFSVAIRSSLITETSAYLYAGCGIVGASDPEKEWKETEMKLLPIRRTLETMH